MEKRQAEAQLPRKERERLVKSRLKMQARRDMRATYDLPPLVRERMRILSEQERIPISQLAALALIRFLRSYDSGEVDLGQYKEPSRSPKYEWNLILTRELKELQKNTKK